MATTSSVQRLPSGRLKYRGETFAGYNKPKRSVKGGKRSAVLAKKGSEVKLVRFGDASMTIKKDQPGRQKTLKRDITAIPRKISLVLGTGLVRLGNGF